MPQMDTATFLPQVFWLLVVFITFYAIVMGYILPSVSLILKVRAKKLSQGKEIFQEMHAEENQVEKVYSQILAASSKDSSLLLQKSSSAANNWLDLTLSNTTGKSAGEKLKALNSSYMQEILKSSAQKAFLVKLSS